MDALEQARAEIDTVDAQLAALFERRMAAVLQVAEYKRAHGLPIYDAAREAAVLEKAAARIQQPALRTACCACAERASHFPLPMPISVTIAKSPCNTLKFVFPSRQFPAGGAAPPAVRRYRQRPAPSRQSRPLRRRPW